MSDAAQQAVITERVQRSLGSVLDGNKGFGPGFDFARIFLAFGVLALHSVYAVTGEGYFLDAPLFWMLNYPVLPMFFGLSGFLITASAQRLSLKNFLINRSLRILPALFVEVVLSALILGPLVTAFPLSQYFSSHSFYTYFLNIFGLVQFTLPGVFLGLPVSGMVNGSIWTVPLEILCYACMSLMIITGLTRRGWTVLLIATGLVAIGFAYQITNGGEGTILHTKFLHHLFVGRGAALLPAFLLGTAAYILRYHIPYSPTLFASFLAIIVLVGISGDGTWWMHFSLYFLWSILVVYIILFIGLTNIPRLPLFSRGDYSYGVYLYGFPIQQMLMYLFPTLKSWPLHFLISGILATLFAVFSWHLIEKPILALRKSFSFVARKKLATEEAAALSPGPTQ